MLLELPPHRRLRRGERANGELEELGDLAGIGRQLRVRVEHPDERDDEDAADNGVDRRQGAEHAEVGRLEAELLVGLAKRRLARVRVVGLGEAAGERDLPGVARQLVGALREDDRRLRPPEKRYQHGGESVARRGVRTRLRIEASTEVEQRVRRVHWAAMVEEAPAGATPAGDDASRAAASVDGEEVLTVARRLIQVPSENPGGNELAAAREAASFLDELGIPVREVLGATDRPSIIATIGDGRPKLVWNGHLDVVPAGDPSAWPHPPWDAEVEDGVLWGRGSADMKGPVAAALGAVAALVRAGSPIAGTLELHLVADEERGELGTKVLLREGLLDADACIVGEPSGMDLGLAQRGGAFFIVTADGRAAHGSTPELGANAIEAIGRVVLSLRDALPPDAVHPLVGRPTINASVVEGGRAANVVPDRCRLTIDRRTLPGETADDARAGLEALLSRLEAAGPPGIRYSVELFGESDPSEAPADAAIARILRSASIEERGVVPRDIGFTGITDARFYVNDAGIETVLFGPGDLRVAHTSNEHVGVDDLVAAARIYARAFATYLRR
jgi:succinyl-diaminopimelate desuccinylase